MKKALFVLVMGFVVMRPAAAEPPKAYGVGGSVGAMAGAAIAGPAGFVVGTAVGLFFGDLAHNRRALKASRQDLGAAHHEMESMQHEIIGLQHEVVVLSSKLNEPLDTDAIIEDVLADGVRMDVHFVSGDSTLTPEGAQRVRELARLLENVPTLRVRLDGYADPRGESDSNVLLSGQRINSVETILLDGGIDTSRIVSVAHGEDAAPSRDGDLDAYAFERRVTIGVTASQPSVAARK